MSRTKVTRTAEENRLELARLLGPLAPLALQRLWSRKRRLIARSSDNLTWGVARGAAQTSMQGSFWGRVTRWNVTRIFK
jgi:hypothetical protein